MVDRSDKLEMLRGLGADRVIDRTFPLGEAGAAMRYRQDGGGVGKIIITPWSG